MSRLSDAWVARPETQAVFDALESVGYNAYFVGGCVRNALMRVAVSDIDIATDATPDQTLESAKAANLRAIPTGYDHGTITVLSGSIPHEVTTFRRDIETDGRHARVAYSREIAEDAARRDFTMNALYAMRDGTVIDPLGGLPDLKAGRVRFIGEAEERIREDYLRSLRFFRFQAWYGDPVEGLDPDALAAISENLLGLETVSKERITAELLKLLSAADPAMAVAGMRQTGALGLILPSADDRALAPLIHLEDNIPPDPIRRLAALGGDGILSQLRLSKVQATTLTTLRDAVASAQSPAELGYRLGDSMARDVVLLRAALLEIPLSPHDLASARDGASQEFPICAADLMPTFTGPALGQMLTDLKNRWIASGFTLTRDDLLSDLGG